jgi:hypothetical protein
MADGGGKECWRIVHMGWKYLMFSGFQGISATFFLTKRALQYLIFHGDSKKCK